jgi:cellulose synthase/poly-beta-1,6-N-acetylglucosamine synthase-like glycosyltransferase
VYLEVAVAQIDRHGQPGVEVHEVDGVVGEVVVVALVALLDVGEVERGLRRRVRRLRATSTSKATEIGRRCPSPPSVEKRARASRSIAVGAIRLALTRRPVRLVGSDHVAESLGSGTSFGDGPAPSLGAVNEATCALQRVGCSRRREDRLPARPPRDPGARRLDRRDPAIARAEVSGSRAEGIDAVYIHRVDRTGYKAGALDNGLKVAKGELVAVFDADFLPQPDFLRTSWPLRRPEGRHGADALGPPEPRPLDPHAACRR